MSVHNRISAIQARMREIQSRFGSTPINNFTSVQGGYRQASLNPAGGATSEITFEKLLASKMKEQEVVSTDSYSDYGVVKPTHMKSNVISSKATDFDRIIREACEKYGVEENFVKAMIQQESGFNPNATSYVGAMGLMQLMPETASALGVSNAYDPYQNIMGGVKYISQHLESFGGDKRKALAAYNAGPGAVLKYGGVPPYQETQNYVQSIMSMYNDLGG